MLNFLPKRIIGIITVLYLIVNTLFWALFLYPVTLLKVVFRFKFMTTFFNHILDSIAFIWIACNNLGLALTRKIEWNVTGIDDLKNKEWYVVISNHQSWTDIVVLQKIFNGKIPFLKFFLKKELIWVPILGTAWWALDFPFMKRYSKSFLEKNPHLKGKDIEITKKACAKFKYIPVSIMNFVEGTRFTWEKQAKQQSPYRNLLKPKSGGVGFVFSTMGEQITSILNVTIAYPGGPYTFWDFLCGKVTDIMVDVETIPLTANLLGDYINDSGYRDRFQNWLNFLWDEKDKKIDAMLGQDDLEYGYTPGSRRKLAEEELTKIN
ncbi:MAG TPA: acyltransferase [Spirochaetota bacterium]|nr:acyltransferase [Spirochaetota bacterium]HPI88452.1 acyltransferase [Spirochaetota bacterium]HPR48815.1 acyltransferase [Spirochaetota bacterium]